MTTTNMNNNTNKTMTEIIKELKEYEAMKNDLQAEVDRLKSEAIDILQANGVDEFITDAGKVTYREVISNRFQTTEFKKVFADLYKSFTKATSCMKFTCN